MTIVTLSHDVWKEASEWLLTNCPSYIHRRVHLNSKGVFNGAFTDYHFSDEQDATLFALRWL
jgi:hypothetical protein